MASWSIKNIDLDVGAVDRNPLGSRKYSITMKINAAGKQSDKNKHREIQVPLKEAMKTELQ